MKKKGFSGAASFLMTVLLSAGISGSAVMCFAESFQLVCIIETVGMFCGCAALFAALTMIPRRKWLFFAPEALVLWGVAVWKLPQLKEGFQAVLLRVTTQLSKDFPIPVMGSSEGDALWFLLPLGLLLAWVTAWVCSRKESALPVALVCAPILVCCLLTVGIAPVLWLVVLTGALILLVVTQSVRRRDPKQGNLLAWRLLIPVVLVVVIPLLITPPETYVRSAWSERLLTMAEERLGLQEYAPSGNYVMPSKWKRQLKTVDLQRVGPKSKSKAEVLQYRADTYITHLRGVSLGIYENNRWSAVDPYLYAEQNFTSQPQLTGTGAARTLNVYTEKRETVLYTSYFLREIPAGVTPVDDAYLENSQKLTEYAIVYSGKGKPPSDAYCDYVQQVYTQLPEELQEPLQLYLMRNGLFRATAGQIANWVKNSAVYDLKTPRTPEGEDFVLYFLEESRRGYCVHFASSTVLLLRAQGIPARYVTGYGVDGSIGQRNTVTADQSHAWVEYFQEGVGWRLLDPTPADWQEEADEDDLPEAVPPESLESPVTPESQPSEEPEPPQVPEQQETPSEPGAFSEPQTQEVSKEKPVVNIPLPDILELPGTFGEGVADTPTERKAIQIPVKLLWQLAATVLLAAILLIQRKGRLSWRKYRCAAGTPNQQALARWQQLAALYRSAGMELPTAISAVAQKARFSQHTVSGNELLLLEQAVAAPVEKLKQTPAWKRFWYRYIRVLY